MPHTKHIHIRYDELAVPEIDLDDEENELEDDGEPDPNSEIVYDDVAIPEIHPRQQHHQDSNH